MFRTIATRHAARPGAVLAAALMCLFATRGVATGMSDQGGCQGSQIVNPDEIPYPDAQPRAHDEIQYPDAQPRSHDEIQYPNAQPRAHDEIPYPDN